MLDTTQLMVTAFFSILLLWVMSRCYVQRIAFLKKELDGCEKHNSEMAYDNATITKKLNELKAASEGILHYQKSFDDRMKLKDEQIAFLKATAAKHSQMLDSRQNLFRNQSAELMMFKNELVQKQLNALSLNALATRVHNANHKWWVDLETGEPIERNKAEAIALMHSELSEALEGIRKDSMDDKLPDRKAEVVELADCTIRILDYCGGFKLDLQGAFEEKMAYNATRIDHTPEHRAAPGGKKI